MPVRAACGPEPQQKYMTDSWRVGFTAVVPDLKLWQSHPQYCYHNALDMGRILSTPQRRVIIDVSWAGCVPRVNWFAWKVLQTQPSVFVFCEPAWRTGRRACWHWTANRPAVAPRRNPLSLCDLDRCTGPPKLCWHRLAQYLLSAPTMFGSNQLQFESKAEPGRRDQNKT